MLASVTSLLAVAAIALAAYAIGRPILAGLGLGRLDRLAAAVWAVAIGLIVCGMLLAALGFLGLLYVPVIIVLTLGVCGWEIRRFSRSLRHGWDEPPESEPAPWAPPPRWMFRATVALAGLASLGALAAALAPPTAGDALCYHLELPKVFLADHGLSCPPDNVNATYPGMVSMWYAWAIALDGPVAAGVVHWGLGVLLGLATVVLATPLVGRPWAWIAGAVVLVTPGVNLQMTAPLCDVALALLTTLALAAWWQAVVADARRGWFVLAGLAAGGSLGAKYLALVFVAAVGMHAAWLFLRDPRRRRLLVEGGSIVAVVAASVAGPWYVRAAWHHDGNPIYPFLSDVADEVIAKDAASADAPPRSMLATKTPLGSGPLVLAAAPWQVTMHPERIGGRGHQLGIVFLAAAAGVVIVRRLRGLGMLLAVAAAYSLGWFFLGQNVRFLLPIVPPLAVAVAWVWIEMRRLPPVPRRLAAATFAVCLAAYAAVGLTRSEGRVAVALGGESRSDYLLRHEPTWPAAEIVNEVLGPDVRLLSQEHRAFYFDCPVTREIHFRRRTGYDRLVKKPGDLGRILREHGFTHLLLAENLAEAGIQYDSTLTRLAAADPTLVTQCEYRFPDADGAVRRYRLVALE